ncbi:DUF4920 domain-containing protein [Pedobacter antarcticus]|uniref:DUF4920 domain-containing protein n=1 Tax=Pedobacter antarcticus TaxID=34086 RepID=UPI001C578639|nr:DUF4920 domain-containing protein [Pedobacter antarcticus]
MKKLLLVFSCCLLSLAAVAQEPVFKGTSLGAGVTPGKPIAVAAIEKQLGTQQEAPMKITGEVIEVCKKKGCWMTLKTPEGEAMRVTFKDYAFFMPLDIEGKTVVLDGVARQQTISMEKLRHYAEDAKKSPEEIARITGPKAEIAYEATGVVILSDKP